MRVLEIPKGEKHPDLAMGEGMLRAFQARINDNPNLHQCEKVFINTLAGYAEENCMREVE